MVVDASVAVKWFLPEIHFEAARRALKGRRNLLAPDLIWAEVGNTLWKKALRKEINDEEAGGILDDFTRFPLQIYGLKPLLGAAWEMARELGVSVYDGLYLALAVGQGCSMITADRKFYELLQKKPLVAKIIWVEEID